MATPIAQAGNDIATTEASLPQAAVALAGAGNDPDGLPITGYLWTLLYKPDGSNAALTNATTPTPTVGPIDVAGNYRVFLQVRTEDNRVSEGNPRLAPASAFVHVRVSGRYTGLERMATGERDHTSRSNAVVDQVELLRRDLDAQRIVDHDTVATGAQLNVLVGGGSTNLHTHPLKPHTIAEHTDTTATGAQLNELVGGGPTELHKHRIQDHWSDTVVTVPIRPDVTFLPGGLQKPDETNPALFVLFIDIPIRVDAWRLMMRDAGKVPSGQYYRFRLVEATVQQYLEGDYSGSVALATLDVIPVAGNHKAGIAGLTLPTPYVCAPGRYLCVEMLRGPSGDDDELGDTITSQVVYTRVQ